MNMNTNNNVSRLSKFLKRHYMAIKGSVFTHTSMGKPRGCFYIPSESLDDFYRIYSEAVDEGEEVYLTEANRHISPIKIDLDFRFKVSDNKDKEKTTKALKSKDIEDIVHAYIDILSKFFDLNSECQNNVNKLDAYVMEKKSCRVTPQDELKDGLHIMFPNIVSKASVQYLIREDAIKKLEPIFERLKCSNPVTDIIDEAIIERNNWLMYGSKKPGGEPYLVTKIYHTIIENNQMKISKTAVKDSKISDFVKILSIRNKYDETKVSQEKMAEVNQFETLQEERQRKMEISKHIVSEKLNTKRNETNSADLEQVKLLVTECLSLNRVEHYAPWIRLGWCLRTIDHRLGSVWEELSKRSNKYIEGECEKHWSRMRDNGLSLGTLHMWARNDNPERYKQIMQTELRSLIMKSRSATHTDIARVVYYMYRHKFVCTSPKFKTWYEYKDHCWKPMEYGCSLRQKLSDEVCSEYINASTFCNQKATDPNSDEDERTRFQEYSKKMIEISTKLKNGPFKDNVMKECIELFFDTRFEASLDNIDNLIGFPNGVYDLDTGEFREGRPEDLISMQAGVDYIPYDPNHPFIADLKGYLAQVFTKPDVREYVCKLFASFLHGSVKDQKFHIWTGSGSNSKSKLVELFMQAFGSYCCIFPVTLLTNKRTASNAANSELARAKGKRFALMSEPSEDEKLNVGLMKELSGGDKILARVIYKEPVEFSPHFKMVLLCNTLPHVPSDDDGTWRRIRVTEFTSKFIDEPQKENEFPIDPDFGSNIHNWRPYFMSMLLEYYKVYKAEGLQEPPDVLKCTNEYKQNTDHLAHFIHTCIGKSEGSFLSLNEAFAELKSWVKDDNISMKVPTKLELEKYLSKNLIKSTTNNNFRGYNGFQLKTYDTVKEDDD